MASTYPHPQDTPPADTLRERIEAALTKYRARLFRHEFTDLIDAVLAILAVRDEELERERHRADIAEIALEDTKAAQDDAYVCGRNEEHDRAAAAERELAAMRRLVEDALHLCQHGENAPGGNETWAGWALAAEQRLRRDLDERGHGGAYPQARA